MFKKVKNKKGFTLIELIVVIAILAVLAAIIIPTVASNIANAEIARDRANVRSVYAAFAVEVLTATAFADATATRNIADGGTCTHTVASRVITAFSCTLNGRRFTLNAATGQITGPVTP